MTPTTLVTFPKTKKSKKNKKNKNKESKVHKAHKENKTDVQKKMEKAEIKFELSASLFTSRRFHSFSQPDLFLEVISAEKEAEILSWIQQVPLFQWLDAPSGRKVLQFGSRYDYQKRTIVKDVLAIPDYLQQLFDSFCVNVLRKSPQSFSQLQIIINSYQKSEYISAHIDHPTLFGPEILTLSLKTSVDMLLKKQLQKSSMLKRQQEKEGHVSSFLPFLNARVEWQPLLSTPTKTFPTKPIPQKPIKKEKKTEISSEKAITLQLPPRSLLQLQENFRYNYTHETRPAQSHRLSITFRSLNET